MKNWDSKTITLFLEEDFRGTTVEEYDEETPEGELSFTPR